MLRDELDTVLMKMFWRSIVPSFPGKFIITVCFVFVSLQRGQKGPIMISSYSRDRALTNITAITVSTVLASIIYCHHKVDVRVFFLYCESGDRNNNNTHAHNVISALSENKKRKCCYHFCVVYAVYICICYMYVYACASVCVSVNTYLLLFL